MDRRCCCWTSQQYKSVWTWSWDQPSSCATTSRGSNWHFINSLLRSWRAMNMDVTTSCYVYRSCEKHCIFSHSDFSNTGHPLESCIYHFASDKHGHEMDEATFSDLLKKRTKKSYTGSKKEGSKTVQVAFRKGTGEDWKTEEFKGLWCDK